jgi:hypothetical protein
MTDEDIIKRLDTMISILRLAHDDAITRARKNILGDPVNAALLDAAASDFVGSGDLKKIAIAATKASEKTVQRRILELVGIGALEVRPTGTAAYRSTGLI